MENKVYWIWLSLACTPGSETFIKLIERFKTPEEIYSASESEIAAAVGSRSRDYKALIDKKTDKAEEIFDFCTKKNVGIITYGDTAFPKSLKRIPTPPVLLYYRGKLPNFDDCFCISVVGTRRLSEYGLKNTFDISSDLATAGATVVSGMAIGIDGVAHAGALYSGGVTVAVIGSGIDVCYPSVHKTLARAIVKDGCVLTEYAPGTKPEKPNFPVRNRIISGLSEATLVIEGKERSGALFTARHATKQGRVVYALPGNVGNINSQLTNLLIKNGAKLCTSADDIISDYQDASLGKLNPFLLTEKRCVNVREVLFEYSVSALTDNDRVYKRNYKKAKSENNVKESDAPAPQPTLASKPDEQALLGFDADTLAIYKKIPLGKECSIESLVDSQFPLRKIMKGLLQLEMGSFVVMLPGEKVKRNF